MNSIIVTLPSADLRALAREALRGKWKTAVIGALIFMAVVTLPTVVLDALFADEGGTSAASSIYSLLVAGAFTLGFAVFILSIFRNKEVEYAQIFYGFERIFKTMGLYLYMTLFILLWTLLLIVPGIIAGLRYSQVFFILADNPDMPIREIMNESKRMMRGNVSKLFCLELSFIGWVILASIPSGIISGIVVAVGVVDSTTVTGAVWFGIITLIMSAGYLWVIAYMQTSIAAMYEIMNGNLRPGVIETTGYIINEDPIERKPSENRPVTEERNRDGENDLFEK